MNRMKWKIIIIIIIKMEKSERAREKHCFLHSWNLIFSRWEKKWRSIREKIKVNVLSFTVSLLSSLLSFMFNLFIIPTMSNNTKTIFFWCIAMLHSIFLLLRLLLLYHLSSCIAFVCTYSVSENKFNCSDQHWNDA